jgi:hypothetical protein
MGMAYSNYYYSNFMGSLCDSTSLAYERIERELRQVRELAYALHVGHFLRRLGRAALETLRAIDAIPPMAWLGAKRAWRPAVRKLPIWRAGRWRSKA